MITPQFKVDQNDSSLIISIKLKYVKISEIEFFVENNNFRFHLKPYFLSLFFSDNLVQTDNCISKYNIENGILDCTVEKQVKGTIFKDIDLLNNLLDKSKKSNIINPKIQLMNETEGISNCSTKSYTLHDLNNILHNDTTAKLKELTLVKNYGYGFNNEFTDVFTNREEELFELADLLPDKIDISNKVFKKIEERYFNKINRETLDFISERYIFDQGELEEINEFQEQSIDSYFKSNNNLIKTSENAIFKDNILSEKEFELLISLKNKNLSLLDDEIYFEFYLQVIDITFSFIYDILTNDLEHTSESGWTINKLSSVLSNFIDFKGTFWSKQDDLFFDNFVETCLKNVIINSFRRVLCYALYRNFDLCNKIFNEMIQIIGKGKVYLMKIMLDIKDCFNMSDPRFLLNTIYIDLFCLWIQKSNDSVWSLIHVQLKQMKINKIDIDLNLEEIENEYE